MIFFYISRFCNEPIERCDGTASNFWIRVLILLDDEKFLVFGAWICAEEGRERKDGLAEEWSGQDSQVSMPELSR